MKRIIDVCTRVEGHGIIRYDLQKNEIDNVNFEIEAIRGFENILLNKKLLDVPRIVSRICGLCYASQSIASCKAIESLYEIEPPEQSIYLRRLLMIGELIKSHSLHFFFQAFPDLLQLFKPSFYRADINNLLHYNPELTSNFLELIKNGKDIVSLFGGRSAHPITTIVGGVIYEPTPQNIKNARKYLQKALTNIKWIIEHIYKLFSENTAPEQFFLENQLFLSLYKKEKYNFYSGTLQLRKNKKILADFTPKNYLSYLDKDRNMPGIYAHIPNEENVLVGPLSRRNFINKYESSEYFTYIEPFAKSWHNNLLFGNILQLYEIFENIEEGLAIIDNQKLTTFAEIPNLHNIKNTEGIGVVEAPRGTLLHHYEINNNNLIKNVKLLVATEINIPTINKILNQESKKIYNETQNMDQVKQNSQKILRMFDPCISCATHFVNIG